MARIKSGFLGGLLAPSLLASDVLDGLEDAIALMIVVFIDGTIDMVVEVMEGKFGGVVGSEKAGVGCAIILGFGRW